MAKSDKILTFTNSKAIIKLGRLDEVLNEKEVTLMHSLIRKIERGQVGLQNG